MSKIRRERKKKDKEKDFVNENFVNENFVNENFVNEKAFAEEENFSEEKTFVPVWENDLLDTCKAASATDCTGLIQISPIDENEIESYKDIYDFGPSPDDYVD